MENKMSKKFKNKSFDVCVQVKLRFERENYPNLVSELLTFIMENHLYDLGTCQSGQGCYIACHWPDDAEMIEEFVNQHIEKVKEPK